MDEMISSLPPSPGPGQYEDRTFRFWCVEVKKSLGRSSVAKRTRRDRYTESLPFARPLLSLTFLPSLPTSLQLLERCSVVRNLYRHPPLLLTIGILYVSTRNTVPWCPLDLFSLLFSAGFYLVDILDTCRFPAFSCRVRAPRCG